MTPGATTHDLSRSRAVLIGNGTFADAGIPDLPSAADCVAAMAELLGDDLCGWPAERVTSLVDLATPSELARRLVPVMREAEDVLLVYYVGHGMRTSEGQLALALRETERHPEMLPYTGMVYADLAKIMRGSRAATKLVILDCCHAELGGKANHLLQSADAFDAHPVDGLYFIGASAKDKVAKAPLDGGLTYFTDAFVRVVRAGLPNRPPILRMDQIFLALRDTLVRADQPEPVQSSIRDAQHFAFARNAAVQGGDAAAVPDSLRLALENPSPNVRRAAVEDLGALMAGTVDMVQLTAAWELVRDAAANDAPAVADAALRVLDDRDAWAVGVVDGPRFAAACAAVGAVLGSGDPAVPLLAGIRVEFGEDRLTLAATDRFRLVVREVPWIPAATGRQVPGPVVVAAAGLIEAAALFAHPGAVGIRLGDEELGFLRSGTTGTVRLLDTSYPDFRKLRPETPRTKVTFDAAAMLRAIEAGVDDPSPGKNAVLSVANGTCGIGRQGELSLIDPASTVVEGVDVHVTLSPHYLLDAVRTCTARRMSLAFMGHHDPVIVESADGLPTDGLGWSCIMPMRA